MMAMLVSSVVPGRGENNSPVLVGNKLTYAPPSNEQKEEFTIPESDHRAVSTERLKR